jgi:hypothetical protein
VAIRLSGPQVGRFASVEAEGLRIQLPKDRKDRAQVGFSVPLQLQGDFEVTATFEIVSAEVPKTGYGVGATVGVDDRARVGRYARPRGDQVILWDYWPVIDGVRKMEGRASPCIATAGRMRLRRSGALLHFEWAPATTGDDFEELHATEYGTDDTKFFTFVAESSGQPCAVDIRVTELRIRNLSEVTPVLRWLAVGCVGLAAAVTGGFFGWRWFHTRLRALPPADTVPAQPELSCPACRKQLRVSPRSFGKKVKCPGCAAVFVASSDVER